MEYIDEYRDASVAGKLLEIIRSLAASCNGEITIMEVCGSHTHAIGRYGIRKLLPQNVRLVSGPGCPVCVSSAQDIDIALFLAARPDVLFVTFGDMLRIPGTGGETLQKKRAAGADIKIIGSPAESVAIAQKHPDKKVVLMGIGFETTTPTIAAAIKRAREKKIKNLYLFSTQKIIPPALTILLDDPLMSIDGFLCPGHVSVIVGANPYLPIVAAGKSAVITGFEYIDILEGIMMILRQMATGKREVAIQYARGVHPDGNPRALAMMDEVFVAVDAAWRGLGMIPKSGLAPRGDYAAFDVREHFSIPLMDSQEPKGCACGDVLKGRLSPEKCPLFKKACMLANPVGPCMVSSEGTCAAYYRYH